MLVRDENTYFVIVRWFEGGRLAGKETAPN
jgi:hypothetical protein